MDSRRGLTRVGILVVVGVVTFVVLLVLCRKLLMLAQDRTRTHAKQIACMSRLKQWGLVFKLYTDDHDGSFVSGEGGDSGKWWFESLRPYYKDHKLWLCPVATKPYTEGGRSPFGAWKVGEVSGSYGLNGWICNPVQGKTDLRGRGPLEDYWATIVNVQGSNNIPILVDAMWFEGWPSHNDAAPPFEAWPGDHIDQSRFDYNLHAMRRFCVNRHEGYVNVLFMDWSVRRVGLKELWTLKWHRNYSIDGPWTKAGGVMPSDWPQWMRDFKDY